MQRRHIGDIAAQSDAFGHLLTLAWTLIGTPLTYLSSFEAVFEAFSGMVAQVVDPLAGFSK